MKEYIKKFANATAANNYPIADIPFTTSVATDPIQNLVCNQSGKKLVNVDGVLEIQPAVPELISFNILAWVYGRDSRYSGLDISCQCQKGMTWREFIHSEYNTDNLVYDTWNGEELDNPCVDSLQGWYTSVCNSAWVDVNFDDIITATDYQFELGMGPL